MSSGVAQETELDRALRRLRENDSSFTTLNLWGEDIGDEGVSVLAHALRVNTSLKWLDMTDINIGDEGVSVLADALRVNASLEWLNLCNNSIGDEGVSVLADALRVNTSLKRLHLSNNSIGDEGMRVLADALRVNTSLKGLDLNDNSIGDVGEVLERRVWKLTEINEKAASPHVSLGQKVELILDSKHDTIKDAVSLALTGLERFSESDERWEMLGGALGRRKHGMDVAKALDLTTVLDMYRHASECGASPALVNLLRAQPSLCEHRDEEEQGGLYPFMLLATMPTAEVGDVFEVLLMKPDLVASAITMT